MMAKLRRRFSDRSGKRYSTQISFESMSSVLVPARLLVAVGFCGVLVHNDSKESFNGTSSADG